MKLRFNEMNFLNTNLRNKYILVVFLMLFSSVSHKLCAQEEIYEKPVEIIDKLPTEEPVTQEAAKTKQQKPQPQKKSEMTAAEKKKDNLSRLRIGGMFGFQFGSFIYLNLSPTVGYMAIRNRLEVGGGPILIYQRDQIYNLSYFVYGPDIYARGYVWKGLYLEGRYDLLNKPSYYNYNNKIWSSNLLLGAGYAAAIGKVGAFNISMLYNVLNNSESIYQGTFSPNVPLIITMGFGFGIGGN